MIKILKRFLTLCGAESDRIKKSVVFGFFDSIFESFPFFAVYYLFQTLERLNWNPQGITGTEVGVISGILVIGFLGRWVMKYLVFKNQGVASYDAIARSRLSVGDRLKLAPMGFFNNKSIGDTVTTFTDDMHYIEQNAANVLEKTVNGYINVLVLSLAMLVFDWRMGLIFLVGQFSAMIVMTSMQKVGLKMAPILKETQARANSKVIEYLMGLSVYKLFPETAKKGGKLKESFQQYRNASYGMEKAFIGKNFSFLFICRTSCAVIAALTVYLALGGHMTVVRASVLLIASFMLYRPLEMLGSMSGVVRMMEVSMNRIQEMEELPVMTGGNGQIERHDIRFDRVFFQYEKDENVIKDVSLHIPEKSMTAIVGASGCGKTTLTRLMARFWDVTGGSISIGGTNVQEVDIKVLYRNFSIVFQKVFLFHDTVENNIRFGNPEASHEDVKEAARKACCHEFIESLPEGYQTVLDENGGNLSGGEKQRISIARAILKDAPIILLDEATSSVDPENEWMLNQAIYELVRNKTVVMIAHKMKTIMGANQIVVMEQGKIHGIGTHEELFQTDVIYQSFCKARKQAEQWTL